METVLATMVGRRIEIICAPSSGFKGLLESVENGVLRLLADDEKVFFVNVGSVVAVSEVGDAQSRPGFIG